MIAGLRELAEQAESPRLAENIVATRKLLRLTAELVAVAEAADAWQDAFSGLDPDEMEDAGRALESALGALRARIEDKP